MLWTGPDASRWHDSREGAYARAVNPRQTLTHTATDSILKSNEKAALPKGGDAAFCGE